MLIGGVLIREREKGPQCLVQRSAEYERDLKAYEIELREAERYVVSTAQRYARYVYAQGMALGILGLLVLIALLAVGFLFAPNNWTLLAVLIAGGGGAVISVLTRMTSGRLQLDSAVGNWDLRLAGAARPFIGAVFGLVLYLFLKGGVVEVVKPPAGGNALYFYAGLAFVMGFSERLAQDMVSRVGAPFGLGGSATILRQPPPPPAAPRGEGRDRSSEMQAS